MSLNYVRPDEEFFGVLKLTNGEEVLARTIVVEESEGTHVAFVQDPAKVHATETMKDEKRAVAVGLKKWMDTCPTRTTFTLITVYGIYTSTPHFVLINGG